MNSDKDTKIIKNTDDHKAYNPQPWTIRLPDAPAAYRAEVTRLAKERHMCVGPYLQYLLDKAIDNDRERA